VGCPAGGGEAGERERGRGGGRVREWTFDADGSDSFPADFFPLLIVSPSAMIKNDAMYHTMMTAWAAKMLCSKGERTEVREFREDESRARQKRDAGRRAEAGSIRIRKTVAYHLTMKRSSSPCSFGFCGQYQAINSSHKCFCTGYRDDSRRLRENISVSKVCSEVSTSGSKHSARYSVSVQVRTTTETSRETHRETQANMSYRNYFNATSTGIQKHIVRWCSDDL